MAITHSDRAGRSQEFIFSSVDLSCSSWLQDQLRNERGLDGKQEENHIILSGGGTSVGQFDPSQPNSRWFKRRWYFCGAVDPSQPNSGSSFNVPLTLLKESPSEKER